MLNKKKVLALVLAAATAFTFAPVSTLGLAPVVEAQAAYIVPTNVTNYEVTSSKLTANKTVTSAAKDGKVTITATTDDNLGLTSVKTDGSDADNQLDIVIYKGHTLADDSKFTISNFSAVDGKTDQYTFDVSVASGIEPGTYTVQSYIKSESSIAEGGSVNITVTPIAVSALSAPSNLYTNKKATATATGDFTITHDEVTVAYSAVTNLIKDFGIKIYKAGDKDKTDVSSDFTLKTTAASNDTKKTTLNLTAHRAAIGEYVLDVNGKTQKFYVTDTTNDVDTIASDTTGTVTGITGSVSNGKVTFDASKSALMESSNQYVSSTGTDKVEYVIAPAGTSVANVAAFNSHAWTNSVNITSSSSRRGYTATANNTGSTASEYGTIDKLGVLSFGTPAPTLTLPSDIAAGTYTVALLVKVNANGHAFLANQDVTFTVTAGGTASDDTNADVEKSDIFGGVTTDILATDNTSYSLVNPDASFSFKGTRYTANQLKWYLTKTVNATPSNITFTAGAGSITESGTGKLVVAVKNASTFKKETSAADGTTDETHIVGIYTAGGQNTIVYDKVLKVTAEASGVVTRTYDAGTISKTQDEINKADGLVVSDNFIDKTFTGVNNKFLTGNTSTVTAGTVAGSHFSADFADASGSDNSAKGSKLKANAAITRDGVYYEKFYVTYTDDTTDGKNTTFVAEITVSVSVNVGPYVEVKDSKDSTFVYSSTSETPIDEKVIYLDLEKNTTFDIAKHLFSNKDNTSYSYNPTTENVTVANGVATAKKVGTAVVKITPTANGVGGTPVYIYFRVNQHPGAQFDVTGKDGDKAKVLTTRQYNGNAGKLTDEEALAAAQVGYVQIEVTGKEGSDVKEALTVSGSNHTYALANASVNGESVDSKTGEITIPHSYLNNCYKNGIDPSYSFPVKVVTSETDTNALTTGYFYVVVDYPDASISGLQDSYTVGTSLVDTDPATYLNLGTDKADGPVHVSSNAVIYTSVLNGNDALDEDTIYDNDDANAFKWTGNSSRDNGVERATVADKTEHVLVSASDTTNRIGHTYKVVELKSVAGKSNYVTKIENVATGKTLYEAGSAVSGASISISKATVVKVTVANAPAASLNPKFDPAFTIGEGTDDFNYNTRNLFVAATEDPKTYEVTLIPSQEGTQIISINPTQSRLSLTDYSLVGRDEFKLAVKYTAAQNPEQVKNVKVSNKKGAKVTVTFSKDSTNKNMKYYVQKKIGKKTSGKSVASTKTTLSVKKGATVKVRVKAYYYDANGVKHVGKYSAWKTLKTDKK